MSPVDGGRLLKVNKVVDGVPYFTLYRDADGNAPTKTWEYNRDLNQAWRIQFGVKYYFN
jgi:hypothetical protein